LDEAQLKRPFVVGDKVRKFGVSGQATSFHVDGFIKRIYLDGTIELDCGNPLAREIAHPKQCCRLVRKERRRVWVTYYNGLKVSHEPPLWGMGDDGKEILWTEYIEVRKPK
jgi:hypothetical protein